MRVQQNSFHSKIKFFLVCFLSAPSFFTQKLFTQSNHARVSYWPIRRRHFESGREEEQLLKMSHFFRHAGMETMKYSTGDPDSNQNCDITDFYLINWDTVSWIISMNNRRKPKTNNRCELPNMHHTIHVTDLATLNMPTNLCDLLTLWFLFRVGIFKVARSVTGQLETGKYCKKIA